MAKKTKAYQITAYAVITNSLYPLLSFPESFSGNPCPKLILLLYLIPIHVWNELEGKTDQKIILKEALLM